MVNEEKVRLMAKAASFEAGEGKQALSMNRFFRGDYISLRLIGAWISFTAAFCLCVGLWAFYRMEYLMSNINRLDLPAMGRGLAVLYLSLLGIFGDSLCGLLQPLSAELQETGGLQSYSEAAVAYLSDRVQKRRQRTYIRRSGRR